VAPRRNLRRRRACTSYKRQGPRPRPLAGPGALRAPFSGRIGARRLAPGRYRDTLVATDAAGNRSSAVRVAFTVVRR